MPGAGARGALSRGNPKGRNMRLVRRTVLLGAAAVAGLALVGKGHAQIASDEEEIAALKPGDYTWHPERSPDGPLAVVVSIPQELVHVYRNGIRIAVSTCSTGRPGHETPTGVFVVLQKDRDHHSSTYDDAPMPNMNRLTWSGIALHAGELPGYPASHGCVRLPMAFSADLYGVTHLGTPVIISGAASDPWELTHPGLVLSGYAEGDFEQIESTLSGKSAPQDWTDAESHPIVSLLASAGDSQAVLLRNDEVIATSPMTVSGGAALGEHVLVLQGSDSSVKGMRWSAMTYSTGEDPAAAADGLIQRLYIPDETFQQTLFANLHPGMIAVLTDLPLTPDRRSGRDFVIATSEEG